MSLSPDEEKALAALLGLGLPEKMVRRAILHLRGQELAGQREHLLAQLETMEPGQASRALEGLAGALDELAEDYEDTL